jgi:hypothetical protein
MKEYNLSKGIVNSQIFEEFEEQRGTSLFHHSSNSCNIDCFLSVAYTLCPDIVEVNGYIFISDLLEAEGDEAFEEVKRLEKQFNCDKTKIEQWVNSRSLGEFFIGCYTQSMDNDKIIDEFAKVLVYFWSRRAKELFPNRNIVVKTGNEIMGELGLTITMYEQL